VAAAQMCHWIASEGRAKFEEACIQKKQKVIMKSLAKGIMSFWCSAKASQTARKTAIMREHDSTMLEGTKTSGIEADKEQVWKVVLHNLSSWAISPLIFIFMPSTCSIFTV
jgi:hypothetical protein